MLILYESLFVGTYTMVIFLIIQTFSFIHVSERYILFITGFAKHFLGAVTGLESYYCNYKVPKTNLYSKTRNIQQVTGESIIEGILFLVINELLTKIKIDIINKNIYAKVFIIGMTLHILFEIFKIHQLFCRNY